MLPKLKCLQMYNSWWEMSRCLIQIFLLKIGKYENTMVSDNDRCLHMYNTYLDCVYTKIMFWFYMIYGNLIFLWNDWEYVKFFFIGRLVAQHVGVSGMSKKFELLDNHLKGLWRTPPKRFIMGIITNPITGGVSWNISQESIYTQTTAT